MKKLLLLLPVLFIGFIGCDCTDCDKQYSKRFILIDKSLVDGYTFEVIRDTKTEKEYIVSGRHSMVEIK